MPMMKMNTISSISVKPFLVLELFNIITIYPSENILSSPPRLFAEENSHGRRKQEVGVLTPPPFKSINSTTCLLYTPNQTLNYGVNVPVWSKTSVGGVDGFSTFVELAAVHVMV